MRISILACILSGVVAICLYVCSAHVLAARHPWFRTLHLIFASLALMVAVHALSHIALYSSHDVASYARASSAANVSGAIAMAILPWLVQGYFGAGSRLAPALMSAFYVLSGVLYELASLGSSARPMPTLEQIALPWGELATIHRVPTTLPLLVFWAVNTAFIGYITVLAVRRRRRGGRAQTIAMVASIAILMLALAGNMLVLSGHIDSVFLGEFGFLALVLTMMRLLSGEESYRAIIAQASAGIFVVGPHGRFLDVNRTGCTMLARSRTELRTLSMADVLLARLADAQPDGFADETTEHGMQRLRRKDGSILLADMSTQVLADGRVLYIARDVTEAQRADAAIRLLAESAPETDSNRFYLRCARSLAEAFDVSHALIGALDERKEFVRIVGRWPRTASAEAAYTAASAPIAKFSRTSRTMFTDDARAEFPAHVEFGDASRGYLGAAIISPTGEVIGVVEVWGEGPLTAGPESHRIVEMFAHRIGTEMGRAASDSQLRQLTTSLETRIAARTAELAQVNEELEAFSYSVSHDLRTPVRAIDAHAALLLERSIERFDDADRQHIERIIQAVRRMRELIDGLLALARLSHQQQEIHRVDLSALAAQAIELLRDRDRAHRVEFICAPNVTACADPTGASIILTNLLENAWKYSSRTAHPRIEFGCRTEGSEPVYFVRDNGVGFDMQHAKHLFEPFCRLHSHSDFPGSGVGLATVQRIVKRHDGKVWAESAVGSGATFNFILRAPRIEAHTRETMSDSA